ncbi:glycine oxidase ThiO [Azospirillum sp. RWY-5-1]|uniref:Glycine oxidase ThiO n=1 Tax=Azospirillum oleiclasticum TaxID=2735135 RepID=A0ABX2T2M6_9PROT|nr:glycine oxidase ThiO [Azospirillum oleiclasticum]NYZ11393.1 glycine oxidase ThiO [Azospirillum oleiclasticum]NYZ18554.1 glycine oxidase ThiO [Azospirillum oleiclasticum]
MTPVSRVSPVHDRIAIVGGGIIGLAVGWRLAQAGRSVDLFEKERVGQGATRAAGGMLAASAEAEPGEHALTALNRQSQALWPDFARELVATSGIDIGMRQDGILNVALTGDDLRRLRAEFGHQQRHGLPTRWLSAAELREREPCLNPGASGAIHSPGDHQVENRLAAEALRVAFTQAGGRIHEGAAVERVLVENGAVRGLHVAGTEHEAGTVLLAAGAWSGGIEGLPEAARPPVRPVKGQMLSVRMATEEPLLRHVVWAPGVYLIPRLDGRLLVGATVEERGFDTRITAGGLLSLLHSAWRALPGIEELPVEETWVGFRPGSRDDAPILGPGPVRGLVYATGHHRNGILLTPITADLVSRFILTGVVEPALRSFGVGRFVRRAA